MKIRQSISRWVYPFFLAVVMFNCLRLATDLLRDRSFWVGSLTQHLVSQVSFIILCYALDILWRNILEKRIRHPQKKNSFAKEYAMVLVTAFVPLNLFAFLGEKIGVYYMGNGIVDYIVQTVVCLPLFLLYYVMIRNEIIARNYQQQTLLLEQIKSKQLETELDYLKAQYHPHFLFNALNTVYFQISTDNVSARRTVELLSELLRYQIYEINKTATMAGEIGFIQAYIQFQQLRTSERLKLDVYIDPGLNEQKIHPLLFQPLLENAFKYVGGDYIMKVRIWPEENKINFSIANSVPGLMRRNKDKGIGIENLRRRLELLYPGKHCLQTAQRGDMFVAELTIECHGNED